MNDRTHDEAFRDYEENLRAFRARRSAREISLLRWNAMLFAANAVVWLYQILKSA